MSIFSATSNQGSQFLGDIEKKISPGEFDLLRLEGGFAAPNDFPIGKIIQVLRDREFPGEHFYEYEWAIYECGFECLSKYSIGMQALLAAIYIYCNKRRRWGIAIESDYFYLVTSSLLDEATARKELLPAYVSFMEWLYDHVKPDAGYDDYYCLLTWTLLIRLSGSTAHPCFEKVLNLLLRKQYSREEIEGLTVSDRGIEAWYELHRRIFCPEPLKKDFDQILLGLRTPEASIANAD